MPLYEYRCKNCGHQFEKIQSFSAPEEKECPVCKGPVERLISAPAVQFKGSGWYATDYASKSAPKKGSGDGESKPADKSSGEKSTAPASDKGTSSGSAAASSPSAAKGD